MTKINKVEANQAVSNSKANASIALSILNKSKEATKGLLKTSLGQRNEIYKKELFAGLNDKQIKSFRRKFRNVAFSILSSLVEETNKAKKEKLVKEFKEFYKEVYISNDFSFSSLASENTKELKKDLIVKGLEIAKNFK